MSDSAAATPDLASPYPLTEAQCRQYRDDGHILLRGVCSAAEVAAYREVFAAAVAAHRERLPPLEQRDTYGKAFIQVGNLWETDPRARRFSFAPRFARIAAELMGVSGVRMWHDQALYKEAGGGHTPWHQDQYYWPLDTPHTITMWMPLVDADESMGTMVFASGSHAAGYLGPIAISDKSEAHFRDYVRERGYRLAPAGAMRAGDATFHSGWTLHAAPGNHTGRTREVMTVIWFADGARVIPPDHPHRESDLRRWLPGCRPGDLAASPMNPLLYPPPEG